MNSKSQLAITIVVVCFSVSVGYWFGQESVLDVQKGHISLVRNTAELMQDFSPAEQSNFLATSIATTTPLTDNSDTLVLSNDASDEMKNTDSPDNNELLTMLPYDASVTELLDFLIQITNNDTPDNMKYFARTMDRLRATVSANPNAIQTLIENFMQAEASSKTPYYIISVLQGSDIPNRQQTFENLAQQLAAQGTIDAQEKLLHLVSSTGMQEKNSNIVDMLTDIALYADVNTGNRLYALDLIMPYQLNQNQKQTIVDDLKLSINTMDEDQKSYAIENLMRFSEKIDRQQMANDFLDDNYDLSTRIAVLSSLHSGTITPSSNLKAQLLNIAKDSADPLNNHAKHALMNVFDISNKEYQTLNNDG